jgi:hypothetical protein
VIPWKPGVRVGIFTSPSFVEEEGELQPTEGPILEDLPQKARMKAHGSGDLIGQRDIDPVLVEGPLSPSRVDEELVVGGEEEGVRLDRLPGQRELQQEHVPEPCREVGLLGFVEPDPPLLEPVPVEEPDSPHGASKYQLLEEVVLFGADTLLFERPALHIGVTQAEERPVVQVEVDGRPEDQHMGIGGGLPGPVLHFRMDAETIADPVVPEVLEPGSESVARIVLCPERGGREGGEKERGAEVRSCR